jgi:hypothetical protein
LADKKNVDTYKHDNLSQIPHFKVKHDFGDTPAHSLKDSNASLKMKTTEKERVGVCSLI